MTSIYNALNLNGYVSSRFARAYLLLDTACEPQSRFSRGLSCTTSRFS